MRAGWRQSPRRSGWFSNEPFKAALATLMLASCSSVDASGWGWFGLMLSASGHGCWGRLWLRLVWLNAFWLWGCWSAESCSAWCGRWGRVWLRLVWLCAFWFWCWPYMCLLNRTRLWRWPVCSAGGAGAGGAGGGGAAGTWSSACKKIYKINGPLWIYLGMPGYSKHSHRTKL